MVRDKVRNSTRFLVAEADGDINLDKLWHNPNASFTYASLARLVYFELNLKFVELTAGTNYSTPHQSLTDSLPRSRPRTPA